MKLSLDKTSLIQVLIVIIIGLIASLFLDPRVRILPLMLSIAIALIRLIIAPE